MKVTVAAYRLMLEIAEAHKGVSPEEAELIENYREVLGIPKALLLEETTTPLTDRMIEGSKEERIAALRAMAQVAYADGSLAPRERKRLHEVALRLHVSRLEMGHLLREEQSAARAERSGSTHRRRHFTVVGGVAALLMLFLIVRDHNLQPRAGDPALQAAAIKADPAVLLLHVAYDLTKDDQRRTFQGYGTGFFVSEDGLIVTSKHVIQPWKFLADKVQLLDDGWSLDEETHRIAAWSPGAPILASGGGLDYEQACDSRRDTLTLLHTAPDSWIRTSRSLPGGGKHSGRFHRMDNHDLALLRAPASKVLQALELAPSENKPRPLDPIVVLGFPRGADLIEAGHAITAPSPGVVRKIEDTVLINAPVYPGNSGGPVINASGQVVGVAARRAFGDDGLGRCIQAKHVRELIRSAPR